MFRNPVRQSVLFATLSLAAISDARAQYELRGRVEAGQVSTCYYCPTITSYVIHASETPIRSNVIDLSLLLNQYVVLSGSWGGTAALPVFEVTGAQPTTSMFAINGNGSNGNTVRFTTHGPTGDLAVNLVALNAGVTPISASTTLLLAASQTVVLGLGPITGGTFRTDLAIPANPALVGLHLFGQALIAPANGSAFYMTEPDAKRIQ